MSGSGQKIGNTAERAGTKMKKSNPIFPVWPDAKCGHCDHDASKDPEDSYLYKFQCPECYRDGCDECMPMGRGCKCPGCEDGDNND